MDYTETRIYHVGASPMLVGPYTYGHEALNVLQWGEGAALHVGAFCCLSGGITVYLGGNHRADWVTTYPFGHIHTADLWDFVADGHCVTQGDVIIGNDVWIGAHATIMSGVRIGDGAIVAAHAHVVSDVGPYEIVGGNPARVIRKRFDDEIIALLLRLRWWELPVPAIKAIVQDLCAPPSADRIRRMIRMHRPGSIVDELAPPAKTDGPGPG